MLITVFTKACHLSLSIQPTLSQVIHLTSISILSSNLCLGLPFLRSPDLRSFLNSALDGTDLSDSRPGRFISTQINPDTP